MDNPKKLQRLPIGIQDFPTIRENNYLYVDKTALLYEMVQDRYAYFLTRPRRFGKSLILSTLQAYFEGRKELFKGLAIEQLEQQWDSYPVIRLDLSLCKSKTAQELEKSLRRLVCEEYERHGIDVLDRTSPADELFGELIAKLYKGTGRQVVILIDEYDKGLLSVLREPKHLDASSEVLRDFYINIKSRGNMIRFSMLTGVARFRHVTVFSGLNTLRDISMDTRYAAICGFTEDELVSNFKPHIEELSKHQGWDFDTTMANLLQ
ncbi:MAG: AAA family ATPase [Bacteroidales bacterium]|nr:AAA family ATPase [Bacteroidales bacterium]